jgi:hypothetical protein
VMLTVLMVVADFCLRNIWEFCRSYGCCSDTVYCGCCGNDADVGVSGLTHTHTHTHTHTATIVRFSVRNHHPHHFVFPRCPSARRQPKFIVKHVN